MKERPNKWEIVCRICLSGTIMSDQVVEQRLKNENTWPKHCGKSMSLRPILVISKKPRVCSHIGCNYAQNALCSCDCEGRYHGVNNEYLEYDKPIIKEKPWYKKPISQFIEI